MHGGINPTSGKKQHPTVSKKWHYLTEVDFKVSDKCCDVLKKDPFTRFENKTNKKPIIGTMTEESQNRKMVYLKNGCNSFDAKKPKSVPISVWVEKDIWQYIRKFEVPYSKIYDMGYDRTGCMFCMFGVHLEKGRNRFQKMQITHPKLHNYCINKLGLGHILKSINVEYEINEPCATSKIKGQ